jgi:hypothetical protein
LGIPVDGAYGCSLRTDHEEIINAGDVYYMAPGHTIAVDAGTGLIEFSPKEEFRKLSEIAEKNFERMNEERA